MLVVVYSDVWLMVVVFYYGVKFDVKKWCVEC